MLQQLYQSAFRRLRGKGLGLGLFNKLHRLVWQGWLRPEVVETLGLRLVLPPDDTGFSQVLEMGEIFEARTVARFQEVVKPGMTVLDLGANVGYYTLLASRLVGPGGRVVAVEPELVNLQYLLRNVMENAAANVLILPYAAGDGARPIDLYLSRPSRSGHSLHAPEAGSAGAARQKSVLVSLEQALPPELDPDVIKMDIEGAEPMALKGMGRFLRSPRLRAVFIEANKRYLSRQGFTQDDVLAPLRAAGLTPHELDPENFLCIK